MRTLALRLFLTCIATGALSGCGFFEASEGACRADDAVCSPRTPEDSGSRDAQTDGAANARETDAAIDAAGETGTHDASQAEDAGSEEDAQVDAGPCGACPSEAPVCLPQTPPRCGCVTESDCPGDEVCSDDNRCVACNEDADCHSPTASRCVGHACEPCSAPAHCAHLEGLPVCDEGECVECTGSDYATCETNTSGDAFVCDSKTRTCTESLAGKAGACALCVSDAHCGPGLGCIEQVFGEHTLPARCFPTAGGGCANTLLALRPFSQSTMVATLDTPASLHCLPITTCQAYLDTALQKNCNADSTVCGEPGVNDGTCIEDKCNYLGCTQDYECPAFGPSDCSGLQCRL